MNSNGFFLIPNLPQAILKTNKWRETYGVKDLEQLPAIQNNLLKARVLNHRDITGRPVIYIPAKNHNTSERDIDELTKFIVFCLVSFYQIKVMSKSNLKFYLTGESLSEVLRGGHRQSLHCL